jgi:peptide/nickel transport system substrate-binding protein
MSEDLNPWAALEGGLEDDDGGLTRREVVVAAGGVGLAALLSSLGAGNAWAGALRTTATDHINIGVGDLGTQSPDPHIGWGTGSNQPIVWGIGEPLIRRDLDDAWVPALATKWGVSNNGLTWTFSLRNGVRMHDGSLFTAQDVKTAFDRLSVPGIPSNFAPIAAAVAAVRVTGDHYVSITTKVPYGSMLIDMPVPIPTEYYRRVGEAAFRKAPMAAGPFRYVSQQINQSMSFERFDRFWDTTRRPNFKSLTLVIVPDESARVAGVQSGALDAAHNLSPVSVDQLRGNKSVRVLTNPGTGMATMFFPDLYRRDGNSPLLDIRVRRAMLYALDRKALARSVLGTSFLTDENIFLPATPGSSLVKAPLLPYNPTKAKQLLAEAGQSSFSLALYSKSVDVVVPSIQQLSLAIASYWEKVGIKVTYLPTDAATLTQLTGAHKLTGVKLVGYPGNAMITASNLLTGSLSATGRDSSNNDPALDALTSKLSTALYAKTRQQAAAAAMQYVADNVAAASIAPLSTTIAVGPHIAEWKLQKGTAGYGPWWRLRAK